MPKRVKMFTSKWHQKQKDFITHPFTSLQCIRFVANKINSAHTEREPNFSNMPLFGAPVVLITTKLDQTLLYHVFNNTRP